MRVEDLEAGELERCIEAGGIVLLPTDTVYGLACDPQNQRAVERIYELKSRSHGQPAAVMFFNLDVALEFCSWLGPRTSAALERLLPGAITAVLPNPEGRYPLAAGERPDTIGLRVPKLSGQLTALAQITCPLLQTSANFSGGSDPSNPDQVPEQIKSSLDLILDAGELGQLASTVVDLSSYEDSGDYRLLREGAVEAAAVDKLLS